MKTGYEAIEMKKENDRVVLNKHADSVEGALENISIEKAEDIASEDPSLIYVKPTEFLVYMDAPCHWDVAEVTLDDDLSWAKNCNGIFDTREDAEAHAARLNK
jgi:hypothetical protein